MGNSCIRGRRRRRQLDAEANRMRDSSLVMLSQGRRLSDFYEHLEDISFLTDILGEGPNTLTHTESIRLTIRFVVRHYERTENETLKKFALFQLHGYSESESQFLTLIDVLVDEVPIEHSLGPSIIGMILDGGCLPTKDFLEELLQQLNFGDAHSISEKRQKNGLCVLAAFAEKLAGFLSGCLVTQEVTNFIHSRLLQLRQPPMQCHDSGRVTKQFEDYRQAYGNQLEVACSALLTVQAFMLTNENRAQFAKLSALCQSPSIIELLTKFESWLPLAEYGTARQLGSLAQLLLDNYLVPDGRESAWSTTDRSDLNAIIDCAESTEAAKVLPDGLEVRSDSPSFESVRCTLGVRSGRWYYEVTLVTDGVMQIGWSSSRSQFLSHEGIGVGDDELSVGVDGCRQCVWYKGAPSSAEYTWQRWRCGDIVGCLLDLSNRRVQFCLNGEWLSAHTRMFKSRDWSAEDTRFYAAASLMANQQCRFNFGHAPFRYPPAQPCRSMDAQGRLDSQQRLVLPWTLAMQNRREQLLAEDFSLLCQICADRPAEAKLLPCGHEGICSQCPQMLTECPFCRGPIDSSTTVELAA